MTEASDSSPRRRYRTTLSRREDDERRNGDDDDDDDDSVGRSSGRERAKRARRDGRDFDDDDDDRRKTVQKEQGQKRLVFGGKESYGIDEDDDEDVQRRKGDDDDDDDSKKEKPSFELSSLLRKEANANERGAFVDYDEPEDRCVPSKFGVRLRVYTFKGEEEIETPISVAHRSKYVFGRDRDVADIPTDHPSCSKQHAVLQFRNARKTDVYGETKDDVAGYLFDNGSTNKTKLNGKVIEAKKYYRLKGSDCVQFGSSTREYVIMDESLVEKKR